MKTNLTSFVFLLLSFLVASCGYNDNQLITNDVSNSGEIDGQYTQYSLTIGIVQDDGEEINFIAYESYNVTGYGNSSWRTFDTPDYGGNISARVDISMGWTGGSATNEIGGFLIKKVSNNQELFNDKLNGDTTYTGYVNANSNLLLQPNTSYKIQMFTTISPGGGDN
ncbi:MAG TPA: hypothetical protein VN514_06660 [Ignavibacteria bacterium]|nr:hypothetical protein [Ignavibacteria bacterium]